VDETALVAAVAGATIVAGEDVVALVMVATLVENAVDVPAILPVDVSDLDAGIDVDEDAAVDDVVPAAGNGAVVNAGIVDGAAEVFSVMVASDLNSAVVEVAADFTSVVVGGESVVPFVVVDTAEVFSAADDGAKVAADVVIGENVVSVPVIPAFIDCTYVVAAVVACTVVIVAVDF